MCHKTTLINLFISEPKKERFGHAGSPLDNANCTPVSEKRVHVSRQESAFIFLSFLDQYLK